MEPTLYCIIRRDLQDYNPGKACAQAMHAQAEFDLYANYVSSEQVKKEITAWNKTGSFGKTIVVTANFEEIWDIVSIPDLVSGMVVDPTYPWNNYYGEPYTTSEVTCAWAFSSYSTATAAAQERLAKLPLME